MSVKEKVVPYMVYYFKKFSKTIFFKKIELQHLILVCDYFFIFHLKVKVTLKQRHNFLYV